MNILWITNKYVEGTSGSRYYPSFLKYVEDEFEKRGDKIFFVFFSKAMKPRVKTKNNYHFDQEKSIYIKNIQKQAESLEKEYDFTFKQAYFPDHIQVFKYQDYRKIHLPEKEFKDLRHLIPKFKFLEQIIDKEKIDVAFCDQSPEVEMEFARAICLKKNKIFMRQSDSFLGRCVFYQQSEFGKERLAMPILDKKITANQIKEFVDEFVRKEKYPYEAKPYDPIDIKDYYIPRLVHFYRYPNFIKLALAQPLLYLEEKIKDLLEDKPDSSKPYLFFGLHLPTEATVTLRALPYMTQTSLIESICRVLPYGHYLYVREHPEWRQHYPVALIRKIQKLPCVRVISPKIPIAKVIKHARGVLTYNATTGIEALMYGKPVLSFAPNVYHGHHSAVDYCSNLYDLGPKLVHLVNRQVDKEETYKYIYKMFRSTSKISIYAGTFLSEEDSVNKSKIFTEEFTSAINYCLNNDWK